MGGNFRSSGVGFCCVSQAQIKIFISYLCESFSIFEELFFCFVPMLFDKNA